MTKPSTAIAAFLPLVLLALPPPPARRTIGDKPAAHRSHEEPCINPLDLDWDVPILSPEEMDWHEIDFGAYLTGFGRGEEIASLQKPQDSVPADELDPEFELWDVEILTAEEMAGLVGSFLADDEDEFFGDSSFESSSRVDRESWDVPILAPMEMGWLEFFEEEDFLHSPHCARHSEDDVLILSPEEMGWLDEDEETFLIRPVVTATENAEPKKAWFPPSPPLSPTAPMRDQVKTLKGTAEDMVAKRARQQPRLNTMLPSPPPSPTPLCQPQAEVRAGSGR
ncbi:hypothetical protein DFJ73DRAFT_769723 [Zopfochytrium polystomum]|nr:hypothetical protein DFJ73DRAFT_769723 [Zopfochytrium polystomum]